ncbi:hypothetical protein FZEAL_10284 [Fusarium zealandicum]|uniref:SP-RING-type domain-containing protein n=1 Tax=Fusarium zealandicum TaxID=1053134 RepID=A0A8H4U3U6_9HYPO|nr:hypothetical protein FZEAL_10284 [Fusarium zealandicum]
MSRRLLSRPGASVASQSSTTALPEYQPPSCPLSDAVRRNLDDLSNTRTTAIYNQQLNESVRLLGSSVGDLHERLREQRERLDAQRAKRQEKGTDKSPDEERLEAHLEDLETRVNALTDSSELAMRELIDCRAELEDEAAIMADLYNTATNASQTQPGDQEAAGESDEGEDRKHPVPPSLVKLSKELRAAKESAYTGLDMHQRYALNNDYAAFKKLWHDAMAGEEGPPLPDASRWFRSDGQPVMRANALGSGAAEDDESDDDIAVAREVLSINCPLTLQPMQQPYSNRKCKHTFEKAALLDYLPLRGEAQCPQTGCSEKFSRARFDHDFYLDQAMMRRIKRTLQAQDQHDMDEEDDDDDGEDDVKVRGQHAVPGRVPKREKVES